MKLRIKHRLKRIYGLLTAEFRGEPDFFIIGVQKGGTTSLFSYLSQHPNLAPSHPLKEINYFGKRYRFGRRWYRSNFPPRRPGQKIFEASTNYIFHPAVPGRIKAMYPNNRFIALLRNPIDRAYSQFHHQRISREEPLERFEDAIAAEQERTAGEEARLEAGEINFSNAFRRYSYLARGDYLRQLNRWERHFPREQLLICSSEEMFSDPEAVMRSVYDFLEVPFQHLGAFEKRNIGEYKDPLSPETREALRAHFKPKNEALFDHLGRRFDWD